MAYRWKARSAIPGEFNFVAGTLENLAPAAKFQDGETRGDGTLGTYDPITGNYTDPGKANVVVGQD